MKGFMTKLLAAAGMLSALALSSGCDCYRNIVDPCYPERYEHASRHELNATMAPQVSNGHVLDQTVWNNQFEPGTERLTAGGLEHLAYLARRRPYPDTTIYLQTAQDLPYNAASPEKLAEARAALDAKRIQAIQNFLTAQTAGRHESFEVVIHDPADVSIAAAPVAVSIQKLYAGSQGVLPTTAGAGASSTSGGGGVASGGGGGGGGGSSR